MPVATHSLNTEATSCFFNLSCPKNMDVLSYKKVRTTASQSCRATRTTTLGGGARLLHTIVDCLVPAWLVFWVEGLNFRV